VSEAGGEIGGYKEVPQQYSLMRYGEHYILFLGDDHRFGLAHPNRKPSSRFWKLKMPDFGVLAIVSDSS